MNDKWLKSIIWKQIENLLYLSAYLTVVVSVVIPLCLWGHHCHQYNKGNRLPWHLKHTIPYYEFSHSSPCPVKKFLIKPKICGWWFFGYIEEMYLLCGMPSWNEGNGIESTKPPSRGVRWFYTQSQKRTTLQQPTVYFTQPSYKTSSIFQVQGGSTWTKSLCAFDFLEGLCS